MKQEFRVMRFVDLFEVVRFLNQGFSHEIFYVHSWKIFEDKSEYSANIYTLICELREVTR